MAITSSIAIILAVLTYFIANEFVRYRARLKGIPGPTSLPIIGNLYQLYNVLPAEQYRLWAETYGDLFQVQLGNMPIVIINSAEAAKDLFLSQGSALNSRPVFHVFHKVVSKGIMSIGTSPWNNSCKKRRKAAASALNRAKTDSYDPIVKLESKELLRELLTYGKSGQEPLHYHHNIQRYSLNLVLTLNYGTRVADTKDLKSGTLGEIVYVESEISKLRSTSDNYSNYIPFLRFFEPFQKSNAHGASIGQRRRDYNKVLLSELKARIEAGTDKACIQGNVIKDPEADLSEDELTSISLSMMAGADSSTPTIEWALLLLSRMPSIQETAYKAIQKVVGEDVDPLLDAHVSYVMAFTKELLRYYTVLRLALPKEAYRDAVWNGYKIPKGTAVFLNAWACNRDPAVFENAFEFVPERWLNPATEKKGISHYSFGYGGRMCIASHLANRGLYIVFLQLIANFRILPADSSSDEFGRDQPSDDSDPMKGVLVVNGIIASPKDYSLRFVPRNEKALLQALN
ncbi:3-hydroxyphenylacetate 6-hydroxylase [Lachnellula willkommii]|uniref:3-hydroxyphenylacetate 6-hydroxylase n=1 Tax=Lachnellula willkommii TaxID=215461 RepID=A0A559MIU5_9HELO|nr:3-hydroxyphenylacetate 6-hydroxylase [Lachnellula willkommii]